MQTEEEEREPHGKPDLESEPEPEGDMYPVEPGVRSLLYEGFSREGRGRANYLRHRQRPDPDQRCTGRLLTHFIVILHIVDTM